MEQPIKQINKKMYGVLVNANGSLKASDFFDQIHLKIKKNFGNNFKRQVGV